MIHVANLSKSYGPIEALCGVSFEIAEGEIVGLLGPNGAGKTTIIKILTGYLQPDEGTVQMGGLDVLTHTREVQAQLGYLPETAPLYPELSTQDYLKMMAELRERVIAGGGSQALEIADWAYDRTLDKFSNLPQSEERPGPHCRYSRQASAEKWPTSRQLTGQPQFEPPCL